MTEETVTAKQVENNWKAKANTETKILMIFIAFFMGSLGIHRFMSNKIGTGVLFLLTFGFLGFGVIFDIIMIAVDNWDYGNFSIHFSGQNNG